MLLGLLEHPRLTDSRLAQRLDLNRSTFASAKAALRRRHIYRTVMRPDFAALGFELLMVATGQLATSRDSEQRRRSWRHVHGAHAHFFTISNAEKLVTMAMGHNYTQLQHRLDLFSYHYSHRDFLDPGSLRVSFFPLALSRFHVALDWAGVARAHLELESPTTAPATAPAAARASLLTSPSSATDPSLQRADTGPGTASHPAGTRATGHPPGALPSFDPCAATRLKPRQRAVLCALVAEPDATDGRIAELAGVSRVTAAQQRRQLYDDELLTPQRVVSPQALGLRLWVLVQLSFIPGSLPEQRAPATAELLGLTPLSYIEQQQEALAIFLFPGVETFQATLNTLTRAFESGGHLTRKPQTQMFLLGDVKFADPYNFAGNLAIGESEQPPHHP